jgi:DNA-binding GntR family transcriptional regulator
MLESLATTRAVERCDDSDRERISLAHDAMLAAVRGGDNDEIRQANQRWHFAIYSAARTRYVQPFVVRLWTRFDWNSSWEAPGRLTDSVNEHQQIMDALLSGSAAKAGELMGKHITGGYVAGRVAREGLLSAPPRKDRNGRHL